MSSFKYLMFAICCTFAANLGAIESDPQQLLMDESPMSLPPQNQHGLISAGLQQQALQAHVDKLSIPRLDIRNSGTDKNLIQKGIARYLWNEDTQESDQDVESAGVVSEGALARYLWHEDNQDPSEDGPSGNAFSTDKLARYLWDEETAEETDFPHTDPSSSAGIIARFLWDEEGSDQGDGYEASQQLASFLWRSDKTPAGHVFDQSSGQRYFNDLSPEYGTSTVDREWGFYADGHENSQPVDFMQVASLGDFPIVPTTERNRPDTKEFILVGKDLKRLKSRLGVMGAPIIDEFEMIKAIGVQLTQAQVGMLHSDKNITAISANQQVETASLSYSAKGASELTLSGNRVNWSVYNLGRKQINLTS
ncbi:MAG: hypothetical protein ACI8W1_003124, partial [Candidatus Azotimanducaceae bacterium]